MFGRWIDDRPEWSVCGLEMCSCVPTVEAGPACPLCEVGDAGSELGGDQSGVPSRRAPIMQTMDSVGYASSSILISAFILISVGQDSCVDAQWDLGGWVFADAWRLERGPAIGVPTPPPRVC